MQNYAQIQQNIKQSPRRWLITGVAGFIGSNLLEHLLQLDQQVIGLDNFASGSAANMNQVKNTVTRKQWSNFLFVQGDICNLSDCKKVLRFDGQPVDFVLHHAALGSVPKSISNPAETHRVNVDGFVNLLLVAAEAKVKRFIYASSSAVYGDEPTMPKQEDKIGNLLSPYALSKRVNELYGNVFSKKQGMSCIGLRYFNIFGPRQDPMGDYAAVIPKWIASLLKDETINIYGDGETSRDFCYVADAVQANILASLVLKPSFQNDVFNIGSGIHTSLNELCAGLQKVMASLGKQSIKKPNYSSFRDGDIRYSLANISKSTMGMGFQPQFSLNSGLAATAEWYVKSLK